MLIVTRLLKERKVGKHIYFVFHFKGVYSGSYIKEISARKSNLDLVQGEDYIIWAGPKMIKDEILDVSIVKIKPLSAIY